MVLAETAGIVIEALGILVQPEYFIILVIGVLLGFFIGVIPGIGGAVTLALLIPVTYGFEPLKAFILMTAALGGINQGASITAILLNTPGAAPNAATIFDGYPMTRNGEAGRAIGAAATVSALGSLLGVTVLLLSLPFMILFVLAFGPPEIFWLGVWGLTLIAVIVGKSIVTGLISALLGMVVALHGINPGTSTIRWDYGQTFMWDGFELVPVMIGLFAVAEMMRLAVEGATISKEAEGGSGGSVTGRLEGVKDVYRNKWLALRSAGIGLFIGAIPGVGGVAANFIAYFQATQTTKNSERYGTGDVRGVIASEGSNDAKDGGGFIPTLGLGIPGSVSMAILLGAFLLHGITPGPNIVLNHMDIVGVIIITLLVSNIMCSILALSTANQFAKVATVNIYYIVPIVLVIAFLGSYAVRNNIYDLLFVLLFGVLGFIMLEINMSRVPLILAVVLTPIVETNFFRALQISNGDYAVFFRSTIAVILALLVVISLLLPFIKKQINERDLQLKQ